MTIIFSIKKIRPTSILLEKGRKISAVTILYKGYRHSDITRDGP